MGMFFFGSKGMNELDDMDEEDKLLEKKLQSLRRIPLEPSWNTNRVDALMGAIRSVFNKLDKTIVADEIKWEKVPNTEDPNYDDIKITIIYGDIDANASVPLHAIFHPECPRNLHEEIAKGLMSKIKKDQGIK
jgi:hypothetical protein